MMLRGPYGDVHDSPTFFEKFPSSKNVQKCPKNESFGLFREICSLVLSGNSAEWKYIWENGASS